MRRALPALALGLTAALLAGCAPTTETAQTADSGVGPTDPSAVIHVQVGLEPTSLDLSTTSGAALQQLLIGNVYEGLIAKNADGTFSPALATDWTVAEDGLTYRFDLREAVFADGSPVTITDVVSSLAAASAEDSVNPDAKRMRAVTGVVASDEDTVEITLASRDINLLDTLAATSAGMILPAEPGTDLANTSNGTGPYTVSQWNKGATITLEPRADYWGEAPRNGGAVFHYITDQATAMNALAAGEVDLLTGAAPETVAYFADREGYTTQAGESTSWMTLGMNSGRGALANPDVRRAINRGIDRAGLIEALGGNAIEVGAMVVPSDPWFRDLTDVNAYDPEAARALLAGVPAEDLALTLTVANNYDAKISEYVAAQLGEIGIDVTINTVEFSAWLDGVYGKKDYDLTLVLHVDPATLTYYGDPAYYWNYDNAEAQRLTKEAREAGSVTERDEKLGQLAELVAEDAASGWLYSPQNMVISVPTVSGFPIDRISNRFPVSQITAQP